MILNYLGIALRNIRLNPIYAFINIASLAVGLAACLVIYLFISDERSFDAWHSKRSAIYRVNILISSQFARLIGVSFVIIVPVVYYLLSEWLMTFAYRISINPLIFLLGGSIAFLIAMLTIGYHTLRSARANPVKALRYE